MLPALRIVNKGNLALKYKITVEALGVTGELAKAAGSLSTLRPKMRTPMMELPASIT